MITSTIEISAPPAIVRDVVKSFFLSEEGECCHTDSVPYLIKWLNFKDVSEWHQGFIESVEVEYSSEPGLVSGHKLKPGDRLHTFAAGMEFHQTILENDEEHIKWYGPWWGLLNGTHGESPHPLVDHSNSSLLTLTYCRILLQTVIRHSRRYHLYANRMVLRHSLSLYVTEHARRQEDSTWLRLHQQGRQDKSGESVQSDNVNIE